jgi:hypothetical protein
MKWPWAILFTLALISISWLIDTATGLPLPVMSAFIVLGTAIWATADSSSLELRKYQNTFSSHPLGTFLVLILLWAVFFPWYLVVRYQRTHGLLQLKPSPTDATRPEEDVNKPK